MSCGLQGWSSFNLLQEQAYCPMCHEAVTPVTCAFRGCAWMYDGRKLGPDGQLECCSSDWQASTCVAVRLDAYLRGVSVVQPVHQLASVARINLADAGCLCRPGAGCLLLSWTSSC